MSWLPSGSAKIAMLLERGAERRRQREHVPDLAAMSCYRRGDVFAVVGAMNGVS